MFSPKLFRHFVILRDLAEHQLRRYELCVSHTLHGLYTKLDTIDLGSLLRREVEKGKTEYYAASCIQLPILITSPEDVYSAELPKDLPNFITNQVVQGKTVTDPKGAISRGETIEGAIVCVVNADPGWDWLFTKNIGGLITCFGGANSHMAIRSAELGLPAIIGCGGKKYAEWSSATVVKVDCKNKIVQIVH